MYHYKCNCYLLFQESRALDPKYFKKRVPPIPTEDREAMNTNHNFKARLPKSLAHVVGCFEELRL